MGLGMGGGWGRNGAAISPHYDQEKIKAYFALARSNGLVYYIASIAQRILWNVRS